jgi:hypothetical protein
MKKGNRRSKRSSIADSSSPSKDESDQPQQNQDCDKRVHDLEKENEALKVTLGFKKLTLRASDVSILQTFTLQFLFFFIKNLNLFVSLEVVGNEKILESCKSFFK